MISFKHEVFFEVARHLSFTKASEVLFISQPAISKHIKQLEEKYKARLFERKGTAISLTAAGKILYEYLNTAHTLEKQIEFDIMNSSFRGQGLLKLGASTTVALYIIPYVLSGFRQKFPEIQIDLFNRNSESVIEALTNHAIDLGIVEGKKKMSKVQSEHFITDEVIPVCSPKSALAKKSTIRISELTKIPMAVRERGSGTLLAMKEALAKHSIKLSDLNVVARLGGTEALKNYLIADDCLGFLPLRAVEKTLKRGELTRLRISGLTITRHFYFIQRFGDEGLGMNQSFIRFAKNCYNVK